MQLVNGLPHSAWMNVEIYSRIFSRGGNYITCIIDFDTINEHFTFFRSCFCFVLHLRFSYFMCMNDNRFTESVYFVSSLQGQINQLISKFLNMYNTLKGLAKVLPMKYLIWYIHFVFETIKYLIQNATLHV